MITLKLASYSQKEVDELVALLKFMQPQMHLYCLPNRECDKCPIKHLCADINSATSYAEEYLPLR